MIACGRLIGQTRMSIRRWPVGRLGTSVLCALWLCRTAAAQDAYYRGPDASRLAPRSALVLGISNYSDAMFPRLPNAETDIKRMTEVLERLGFDIHPKSSGGPLTRQRLKVVLYDYIQHVRKVGGVSLIYFAGHGVGDGQHSYLVPYDGMALYSRDLREEMVCFVGLGAIGTATLRTLLGCVVRPRALMLCDVPAKRGHLEALAHEIRVTYGFRGDIDRSDTDMLTVRLAHQVNEWTAAHDLQPLVAIGGKQHVTRP